jgi:hypothetical protein
MGGKDRSDIQSGPTRAPDHSSAGSVPSLFLPRGARVGGCTLSAPSKSQILQARLAAALVVALIVLGAVWYGISFESLDRLWRDILARPGGPLTFRFILQPAMATVAAFRDGVEDARLGRMPYLLSILRGVQPRGGRLWEGLVSTSRILVLGIVIDAVYQWLVLKTFYPGQAAAVAILLAFVPYLLLRGPLQRIARHWFARREPNN